MNDWLSVSLDAVELSLNVKTLEIQVCFSGITWKTDDKYAPKVQTQGGTTPFSAAERVSHEIKNTGLGTGILSSFAGLGGLSSMSFYTWVWIEKSSKDIIFEWIPVTEAKNIRLEKVLYPAPFEFNETDGYTALTFMQGVLLPNNWQKEFPKFPFGGQMCSEAAYMPWWGQVRGDSGYIAIVEQPWDAAMYVEHPAGGPTRAGISWLPSLGEMNYKRTVRLSFMPHCDYNDLCKQYRAYVKTTGLFTSLAEKAARVPLLEKLFGSAVIHLGIKSNTKPESRYYNAENPEKNHSLTSFSARAAQIKAVKAMGLQKAYLHLDGWGQPGYDNQHPDYLPPCEEAGGWKELVSLSQVCRESGYLFGLHDQYRDYYLDAETYDPQMAVHLADGTRYEHAIWAGGRQNYLCPSLQPKYVRRNFEELFQHGVLLDASYLDVFTCNEPDECAHPLHRVTRRECLYYRRMCFDYLLSQGILTSSEEAADWAMNALVFCHWAPYPSSDAGIPVPLFNLVYHDCIIIPWMLGKEQWGTPPGQLGFLHALLNGGIGYFNPECGEEEQKTQLEQVQAVGALHEKIGGLEMVRHEFLSDDKSLQRTTFADGTSVRVDFIQEQYEISAD
ncbi:MAG: DUF5696 domain-containing protein [Treponema sp.]|jgi:hypothetical protein|nr:DUF5696 domain-containing protein [Treponema sp.]